MPSLRAQQLSDWPPETTRQVALKISTYARRRLDAIKREGKNTTLTRASLSPLFHGNYVDNRPPMYRQGRVWAVRSRTCLTTVALTAEQIAAVVELAEEHDIDVKYFKPDRPPTYLLGQFLEAVLNDHLVAK
jgi:hypothetical protein